MEARKEYFSSSRLDGENETWKQIPQINNDLLAPLHQFSGKYWALIAFLSLVVAAGAAAWIYQIETGIGQTHLHLPIYWGIYIASFVYWIGVSHSGTFISGVLRLSHAEWRRPITRISELMTLFSIVVAALFIFIHLGRVWRFYYLIPYPNQREIWPNFRSPLMWDATAIFTYAVSSTIYLYLPLIPDFALARDRMSGWRRPLYGLLSVGWSGTQIQWRWLLMAVRIVSILIVLVMVSVHSIVGFDFAVALVPGWHSTVMAPYFVVGAVHSGVAMVAVGLYLARRYNRLDRYIGLEHFDKLGKIMIAITLSWGYLYFVDRLVTWYGKTPEEMEVIDSLFYGQYASVQWFMVFCNFIYPIVALRVPSYRTWPLGMMLVGLIINIGMYLERIMIIVPGLGHPRLHYAWTRYFPSWVELTILSASFAFFALIYLLAAKFVPLISIWEEKEGRIHGAK